MRTQERIGLAVPALAICLALTVLLPARRAAADEGCSSASAKVEVQTEEASYTYYVVSTAVAADAQAKKEKAERVIVEIDAKLAAEGVDRDGVPYREEVPLHFRLVGVHYGSYSRTVKGEIRGPQVNRRILGITIQRVACQRQDPGDQTEDSYVS